MRTAMDILYYQEVAVRSETLTKIFSWIFYLIIILTVSASPVRGFKAAPHECPLLTSGVEVFLTVSSLASMIAEEKGATNNNNSFISRQLELNWIITQSKTKDWVGLFNVDPSVKLQKPLERIEVVDHPDGYYRTSVQLPKEVLGGIPIGSDDRCLDFWIGYVRNNAVVASQCLWIRPNWMWDSRDVIGDFRLHELMLPGTHDAGSYKAFSGKDSDGLINRFSVCQEETIGKQLMYGIRHFDLRIAMHKADTENPFWMHHGPIKFRPLREVLNDVKAFVRGTKEIVVLDFHEFLGDISSDADHAVLVRFIKDELADLMAPRRLTYYVKLNELWAEDKRIVAAYNDDYYKNDDLLWSGIPQIWANTLEVDRLKDYLESYMEQPIPFLWSSQAELTFRATDIFTDSGNSLRKLADKVNRNVTRWFSDHWWNKANIVATDFFKGNNMVEVAIASNRRRKCAREALYVLQRLAYYASNKVE